MNTNTLSQKPINRLPGPAIHQQQPVNMLASTAESHQKPINMIKTSKPLQQNSNGKSTSLLKKYIMITTKTIQSTDHIVSITKDEKTTSNKSYYDKTKLETTAVPSMTTAGEDLGKQTTEKSYLNKAFFTSESYENMVKTSTRHASISPEQARITSVFPSNRSRNTTTQKIGGESVFKLLSHEIQNANIIFHV